MWKYYKRYNPSGSGLKGKVYGLFRVKGVHVERYAGLERWIVPPFAGQVLLDISGAGGGWATIDEVTPEEAEEIKRQLFDKDGNRIAPV
ncbi:MAG: hypothetical protein KBA05_06280 [Anaerolineaceae bacterium]|jgi:hypothetical protein|nr:hypothetical protein [Anaerolineaceae bacterium]MDI9530252.1 hypothetical protein [Chloroflexota bacterium]